MRTHSLRFIKIFEGVRCVVTNLLGSSSGSGCIYREYVLEVRQGAILNLFLPRMRRAVSLSSCWREVEVVTKVLTSSVSSLPLLPSF